MRNRVTSRSGKWTRSDTVFVGSVFLGTLGAEWLGIQIYDRYQLAWLTSVDYNALCVLVIFLVGLLVAMISAFILIGNKPGGILPFAGKRSFGESLVDTLESALNDRMYWEVIRIGSALNRPLFESGDFAARVKIGQILEEAAALSGRKDTQIIALIDLIGWSLVERGKYEDAQRHVRHGIELAEQERDHFYVAKGQRHLGVIERRKGRFKEALVFYEQSRKTAELLEKSRQRDELVGGLDYALACLYFFQDDHVKALEWIDAAIQDFIDLQDPYRLNMSRAMKGDIQFKTGDIDKARDTFRDVLESANKNTERLQIARCYLGLGEIYVKEYDWSRAAKILEELNKMDLEEFKTEYDRRVALAKCIPDEVLQ